MYRSLLHMCWSLLDVFGSPFRCALLFQGSLHVHRSAFLREIEESLGTRIRVGLFCIYV